MKNELREKKCHLSVYEQNVLLPILMQGLEMKKGKANAVTARQIIDAMRKHGLKISRRSILMLISHIRTNDLIVGLMATSAGYYITSNERELMDYEDALLGRESAIRKVRMSIKRQRRGMFSTIAQRETQLF